MFIPKDLWSNTTPKVISQIGRYERQIMQRNYEILSECIDYTKLLSRIFGISLPAPIDINKKVTLLVFGFDNDQKNGRLKNSIIKNSEYKGIKVYPIGNVKQIVTENLWNAIEL